MSRKIAPRMFSAGCCCLVGVLVRLARRSVMKVDLESSNAKVDLENRPVNDFYDVLK